MDRIQELIETSIKQMVAAGSKNTEYREPIIAFADAEDPEFDKIRDMTHQRHMKPKDWMPQGKTVVSYFIPFTRALADLNRKHGYVAREWAVAYIETNNLIKEINKTVCGRLKELGVDSVWQLPLVNYDSEKLMSYWSQRHVAFIAGIGTFGMNNMLITGKGCSGRYGSFIIDHKLEAGIKNREEKCLYKKDGSCGACMKLCPVQALSTQGFDRYKCSDRTHEVNAFYKDLDSCDCCGKCLLGPCAIWE